MSEMIQSHCETATESPYSRDRRDAIEELSRLISQVGNEDRRRIVETLRRVAHEATASEERALAREVMRDAVEIDSETVGSIVASSFCTVAAEGIHREDQLDAIDGLRELYPAVGTDVQDEIGQQLAELAGNATYEDVRRRARHRLSDVTAENTRREVDTEPDDDGPSAYLATSLSEHLSAAADESPDACHQRAQELYEFVVDTPVDDAQYDELQAELEKLVEQLEVVPTGDELDTERRERVTQLASRVQRTYERQS
jgi:hypothetical protein